MRSDGRSRRQIPFCGKSGREHNLCVHNRSGQRCAESGCQLTLQWGNRSIRGGRGSQWPISDGREFRFSGHFGILHCVWQHRFGTFRNRRFPFKTGSGTVISGITVSPNGKTVYVTNFGSGNISALALASNGALTPVAGSPFAVDSDPRALQVDPTGKFAYVPALSAPEIEIYSIAADGSLAVVNRIRTRQQAAAIAFSVGSTAVTYSPKFSAQAAGN